MHIIGTAGHVDHGKSALVQALTGTDPDRWIEEKLRGMTLDLGFAHLRFEGGVEAGIVDVPGHQRFLHNMLAGAAAMELLLLVVAANEGPRPQTIEHLAILSYLNVQRAIVVLTKSDLVDETQLAETQRRVRQVAAGTVADDAPLIAVSTVTREGLVGLRETIHQALLTMPPRAPKAPPYFPIDRVFALPGHGTILTGTLMQGEIAVGDTLLLTPPGRNVRVRSLQVFGEHRERATGGSRVAINVPGVNRNEVHRGAVLVSAELQPQRSFAVTFNPYEPALNALRRRMPVRASIGSGESLGILRFDVLPAQANGSVPAVLHLHDDTVALPGAPFILRGMSPKELLGGGRFQRAIRVPTEEGAHEPNAGVSESDAQSVIAALRAFSYDGATAANVGVAGSLRVDLAERTLQHLYERGNVARLRKPDAYIDAALLQEVEQRVTDALQRNEAARPWMFGTTLLALSRETDIREPTLVRVLAALVEDGRITSRAGYYATPGFVPTLTEEQRAFFDRELAAPPDRPYLATSFPELLSEMKSARIPGLSQAFDTLLATGAAVKIGDAIYRGTQIAAIRRKLEVALQDDRELTMAQFRNLIATSRKYAVPLLEWFDLTGTTVRDGDVRRLRGFTPPTAQKHRDGSAMAQFDEGGTQAVIPSPPL